MKAFFDYNATTPLAPEAFTAMRLDLEGPPANPSSVTAYGRTAKMRLLHARETIAAHLKIDPDTIVFTSGATEANHLLVHGFRKRPGTAVTTAIEHTSLIRPIERWCPKVHYLATFPDMYFDPDELSRVLQSKQVSFVALSLANSETGMLLSCLSEIKSLLYAFDVPLILDCSQALGKMEIDLAGVAGASFSAHKCFGPKGVGIAVVNPLTPIAPLFQGGHQEGDMRAGTENVAGILGFAAAVRLIDPAQFTAIKALRDRFEKSLLEILPDCEIHGGPHRLGNTSSVHFKGIDAEALLIRLDREGCIISLGSACSAGSLEPSHVLLAAGHSPATARSSLRFSFHRTTTPEEIDLLLETLSSQTALQKIK
ncbi:MAG: hypothetical protein A3F09_04440 [Chlamydiae bacterium RIFCSPHIGHO2_12_FULL_49_11]|nr:MAG: hypothetical protein A3F09_04440 [Chlamydiae bacterium RIFCSPHIGHO2_12_FULL_49_11]